MKIRFTTIVIIYLAATFLISCKTTKQGALKQFKLTITNPSSIERADELVVLNRATLEEKTGALGNEKFINITADYNPVTLQYDDLNNDSVWDEVVFMHKFEPNAKVVFSISQSAAKTTTPTRAHVRMRRKNEDDTFGSLLNEVTVPGNTTPTDFAKQKLPPYLTEGPAWENDKVAFRIYMDTRNTKDIYGKMTAKMMMDIVGVLPKNSYHSLSDWGMDILAVGKSLGAGSLALQIPFVNGKDTLVRLGGKNVGEVTYEKIADGPVRAMFRMHYTNWSAIEGITPINVTEEISIWGGKFFYETKVTVSNAPAGTKLVTGIVNLKSKKANELVVENSRVLYTYDVQSENNDKLGLGIMVRNNHFESFGKTPNVGSEVLNTYTVTMPLSGSPAQFRFYSGWELSDLLFTREESFQKFLNNEAVKYSKPLILSWN